MIVRLGNKAANKSVEKICNRILEIDGTSLKQTPKRCIIMLSKANLVSVGAEKEGITIDFRPSRTDYPDAHGSTFVRPHSNSLLAKEGWLIAHPQNEEQQEQVISWVHASIKGE